MLEYLVFRLLSLLAPRIPPRVAYWLCNPIGDAICRLLAGRRRTVRRNLSTILGPQARDLDRRTREVFREGVKNYYDTFLAPALSDQELERLVSLEGWDNLRRALERGKGVVLVTAHLGSPSLVAQILGTRKCRLTVVAEPLRPRRLFELMARVRATREGIRIVPFGPTVTGELTEALRRNEIVGLVADRDISKNGVPVRFFGVDTLLPVGPVMLALRTGAALVPAFTHRLEGGSLVGRIDEPMELERTGSLREDLRLNTQKLATVMEEAVRKSPEQWTVFEPIWPEEGSETRLGATS